MTRAEIVVAFTEALPFEGLMSHEQFDAVAIGLGLDPNGDEVVGALVGDGWRYTFGEYFAPNGCRYTHGEYCAPDHRLRECP